jgi:PKD repeat protein
MSLLDSLFGQTINYSYLWDFGDNTTSTFQNPTHVYLSTGTYSATVTVTTSIGQYNIPGCSQSVAIPFTIQIYAPNSAFTATTATSSTCPPLQVCFAGPNPPAGDTYSYFWEFGDPNNTTSNLQNPCNIYTVPGQFDVTLVVLSNNFGCFDTTTYTSGELMKTYHGLEPRFSFAYRMNESSAVKGSYSRTRQNVHQVSSGSASLPTDIWIPSTTVVKPQIADQVAIGYFKNFKDNMFETSVELYYKKMYNQIEFKNGSDAFLNPYLDKGLSRLYAIISVGFNL